MTLLLYQYEVVAVTIPGLWLAAVNEPALLSKCSCSKQAFKSYFKVTQAAT